MVCKAFIDFFPKKQSKREGFLKGLIIAQSYDCLLLGIQMAQALIFGYFHLYGYGCD